MNRKVSRGLVALSLLVFLFGSVSLACMHEIEASGSTQTVYLSMPSIAASNNPAYEYMIAASSYQAYFMANSLTSKSVSFSAATSTGNYVTQFDIANSQAQWYNSTLNAVMGNVLNTESSAATVQSTNMVKYAGAWANTNLTYTANLSGITELMQIASLPTSVMEADYFRFRIDIYYNSSLAVNVNGVNYLHPSSVKLQTSGAIAFLDSAKNTVFSIPAPCVYDSAGHVAAATYFLDLNNGVDLWYIGIPDSFIKTAVYPIFLDPTLQTGNLGTFVMPQSGSVSQFDYVWNTGSWPSVALDAYIDNAAGTTTLWSGSATPTGTSGSGSLTVSPSLHLTGGTTYELAVSVEYSVFGTYYWMSGSSADVDYTPDPYITVNSAYGNPTSSGSVVAGGSYATSVTSPWSGGSGIQYICTGYEIDGGSLTAGTSYAFTNVQASHTIVYEWQTQYYLTVTSLYGSPSGQGWYSSGATASFNMPSPVAGATGTRYAFSSWTGLGSGAYSGSTNSESVTMNNPITETAAWTTQYTITPSADAYSTITPNTVTWVNAGGSQAFSFSANTGHTLKNVIVNNTYSVSTTSPFTFLNVQNPESISVSTSSVIYYINATSDSGCAIYPSGPALEIPYGTWVNFTCLAYPGYEIYNLAVNGVNMGPVSNYDLQPSGNTTLYLTSISTVTTGTGGGGGLGYSQSTPTPVVTSVPVVASQASFGNLAIAVVVAIVIVICVYAVWYSSKSPTVKQLWEERG